MLKNMKLKLLTTLQIIQSTGPAISCFIGIAYAILLWKRINKGKQMDARNEMHSEIQHLDGNIQHPFNRGTLPSKEHDTMPKQENNKKESRILWTKTGEENSSLQFHFSSGYSHNYFGRTNCSSWHAPLVPFKISGNDCNSRKDGKLHFFTSTFVVVYIFFSIPLNLFWFILWHFDHAVDNAKSINEIKFIRLILELDNAWLFLQYSMVLLLIFGFVNNVFSKLFSQVCCRSKGCQCFCFGYICFDNIEQQTYADV